MAGKITPSPSPGESRHIEWLEQELACAKTRLEASLSPDEAKQRNAKLKALAAENRSLHQELDHLQRELTLQEDEQRRRVESLAEDRLKSLEVEGQIKDAKIRELEWEADSCKKEAQRIQDLQAVNQSLEQRIETLVGKLAESPDRTRPRPSVSSPSGSGCTRQLPRLQTSFSRTSYFYDERHSLSSMAETGHRHKPSPILTRSPSAETQAPFVCSPGSELISGSTLFSQQQRLSRLSLKSTPTSYARSSISRPCSLMSASSLTRNSWDSPTPAEGAAGQATGGGRRMRRFGPGSKTLKPLVLPVAGNRQSLPASASVRSSLGLTPDEYTNQPSESPVRLTPRWLPESPESTPVPVVRYSTAEAHGQALMALEGKALTSHAGQQFEVMKALSEVSSEHLPCSSREAPFVSAQDRPNLRSLLRRIGEAESGTSEHETTGSDKDIMKMPNAEVLQSSATRSIIGVEHPSSQDSASTESMRPGTEQLDWETLVGDQQQQNDPSGTIQEDVNLQNDVATSEPSRVPLNACLSRGLLQQQASGIFTRLSGLIIRTRLTPVLLIRRLLSNVLSLASGRSRHGMLWWLLGPAYRRRMRGMGPENARIEGSNIRRTGRQRLPVGQTGRCSGGSTAAENSTPSSSVCASRDYGAGWLTSTPTEAGAELPQSPESMQARRNTSSALCSKCEEPSTRRALRLWFQFSLMIILAVGMAFKHGPEALLETTMEEDLSKGDEEKQNETNVHENVIGLPNVESQRSQERGSSAQTSQTEKIHADSGYGSPETLGSQC